jgi:catechol 1,2-dioxygenase
VTDENGYYEFETIYPGAYKTGASTWRPNHIHYMIRHPGYKTLITQLYFRGDKHQDTDPFIHPSLIIDLQNNKNRDVPFKSGGFDIILAPEK